MLRWLLGPVVRIDYGIEPQGRAWLAYFETIRVKHGVETIRRRIIARCDSQREAEAELLRALHDGSMQHGRHSSKTARRISQ